MKHPYLTLLCTGCLALSSLLSCSDNQVDDFFKKVVKAPPSSIERDVKGHDQIYAVHAILRMGYPGGTLNVGPNGEDEINVYRTIHEAGDSLSLPVMQEIDIAKDDDGQMTVTTARNHFDVVASDSLVYGLELRYYDQNGLLINHQFSSYYYKTDKQGNQVPDEISSALQMHQHFFGIGHSTLDQNAVVAAGKAPIVEKRFANGLSSHPRCDTAFHRSLHLPREGRTTFAGHQIQHEQHLCARGFDFGQQRRALQCGSGLARHRNGWTPRACKPSARPKAICASTKPWRAQNSMN